MHSCRNQRSKRTQRGIPTIKDKQVVEEEAAKRYAKFLELPLKHQLQRLNEKQYNISRLNFKGREQSRILHWRTHFETRTRTLIDWKQCFSTLKMAIMARNNHEVDKLIKLEPQAAGLFYPTLPTYEDDFEGERENQARNRE